VARRRRISCLLAALALLGGVVAGCGNSRTPVPPFGQPAPPDGVQVLDLPAAGVVLLVPRDWVPGAPSGRLMATIASGSAAISVWSYPRRAPAPVSSAAFARVRSGLLAAARRRDPALRPIRIAAITLAGLPALELDALEHIRGQLRRVRSVHVYAPGQELVLDAYAPPSIFHSVDHAVFSPVKRSLRFLGAGGA
jgi:hypothetical protein